MSSASEGGFPSSPVPSLTPVPRRTTLLTGDGVRIEAVYTPCAADSAWPDTGPAQETAVVLAHGFTGSADRPAVVRAARVFSRRAAVITFSFRGHGRSGGRSTVGDREAHDLAAAVAWARSLGHRRVVTVGFSMGGSVVLRHAALATGPGGAGHGERDFADGAERVGPRREAGEGPAGAHTDAVVAVSAPARWYYRGTAPMRRLHWVVTRPAGRLVGRY
ncbi:alpha/beta hydrolase, partial [Streptomyces sp. NRRL WC-3549]|uniref:alpha/beta hydrolase n=1 Tax=Streptomyces sp. NRRL WC-3549 TaxID=1463925 RepID=UPI0009E9C4B2